MIINPILATSSQGGANDIVGHCLMRGLDGKDHSYPIYKGIVPLDNWVMFESANDVVQQNGDHAEYVCYVALETGDYILYRGVMDGDNFKEQPI